MTSLKDIWKSHPVACFAAAALLLGLMFLFVKNDNLVRLVEAEITIRRQNRRIEELKREISRMDTEAGVLNADRDSLEKMARETFLFCEPGEDVYLVDKSRQ